VLVEAEERIAEMLKPRRLARIRLDRKRPALNKGWRVLRLMQDPKKSQLPAVTVNIWGRIFAKERKEMREARQLTAVLRDRSRFITANEAFSYKEWLRTADELKSTHDQQWLPPIPVISDRQEALDDHLGALEAVAPSQPRGETKDYCTHCEQELLAREAKARADEAVALFNARSKAKQEAAASGAAKKGEPVIRATHSPNSNAASLSGGSGQRDYDLSELSHEEKIVFKEHVEGKVVEPSLYNTLKTKWDSTVEKAIEGWVNRGMLYVPPAFG